MDSLQKQVTALTHKVDGLYQSIDQLTHKVSEALSEHRPPPVQVASRYEAGTSVRHYQYQHSGSFDNSMEHKDVLVDNNGFDNYSYQSSEKELSPDIQIQRLTAQLTAAYNRIAALEEQLLSRRIHS